MLPMNRVTLITLSANDVAGLAGFYKALGWVASHELEETVFFDMVGLKFGIYNRAMLASDMGRAPEDLGTGAATLALNFPDKASVDAAFDAAIAAGGKVLKRPEDIYWGGYSSTWEDPEGHAWEYAWNPFWELTEDGRLA